MGRTRATRFLIDRVDARLGDVNKEIKMDKTVIAVSICFLVVELILILLACNSDSRALSAVAIAGGLLSFMFIYILGFMIKELKEDIKKRDEAKE